MVRFEAYRLIAESKNMWDLPVHPRDLDNLQISFKKYTDNKSISGLDEFRVNCV